MFERFTDRARHAFVAASDEARALGHTELGSGHLLLGLLHDEESDAGRCLGSLGVTLDAARERVGPCPGDGPTSRSSDATAGAPAGVVAFTPRAKEVLERSLRATLRLGDRRIGTADLLLGIVDVPDGRGAQVLRELDVDLDVARRRATETIGRGVEAGERAPAAPIVVPELSPQARDALQTALRLGSTYLAHRYAPVRMLRKASSAGGVVRRLTSDPAASGLPSPGPAIEPGRAPRAVPATCASCGTESPRCGTLYTTPDGTLVCERCVNRQP